MGKLLNFRRPEPEPVDQINESITISVGGDRYTLDLMAAIRKNPPAAKPKTGLLVALDSDRTPK